jgi:hypothetical protein
MSRIKKEHGSWLIGDASEVLKMCMWFPRVVERRVGLSSKDQSCRLTKVGKYPVAAGAEFSVRD